MSASSRSPARGKRDRDALSPPRRGGTIDLVKELAMVRDHNPSRFPSAYLELKVPQIAACYLLWSQSTSFCFLQRSKLSEV